MALFRKKKNTENTTEEKPKKKKKSKLREWVDAIVFAVIAATLIRWLFLEAFTIPTPSMEKSLLVGDFLFVSKMHYGARTPRTLLQVPLTHQKIWGTNIPSYLSWPQLPMGRISGLGIYGWAEVKRNDVVVFNYPPEFEHPIDLKTNYIKRCVAIGGDTLEVRNRQVYINGKNQENPPGIQHKYFVQTDKEINEKVFEKNDITEKQALSNGSGYEVWTSTEKIKELQKISFVKSVIIQTNAKGKGDIRVFPNNAEFDWNEDNFGPLVIPAEGMQVKMDKRNVILYGNTIKNYEIYAGKRKVEIKDDKLLIDGKEIKTYTFQQNYYFMMGDNRHNSLDSRFWGFVPKDHVVGRASFIWLSLDSNKGLFNGYIRWGRIFKGIY